MHDVVRHKIVLQQSTKLNLYIQNAEDTLVSIILAFNHFAITHNCTFVPTSRQYSYLPDFVDYTSGEVSVVDKESFGIYIIYVNGWLGCKDSHVFMH